MLEEEEEEEEEESEPEPEEEEDERPSRSAAAPGAGAETPSGLATPSGFQSMVSTVPGGLETPDFVDLRKKTREDTEETPSGPKELYHVIPERETTAKGFMGSSTAYDLSNVGKGPGPSVLGVDDRGTKVGLATLHPHLADEQRKAGDVEISVDTDGELSQAELKKKYEEQQAQQNRVHVPGANADRSGFEDVMAGEMKKRQRKEQGKGKEKEKEKFKF